MNLFKKLALVLMTTIFVYFLTSCSKTSYELFYEYYNSLDGYIVYSEGTTLSRFNLKDNVEIPSLYSYKPVVGVSSYTFFECSNLQNIVLSSNLKQIGAYSFSKCVSLRNISLPNSLEIIDSCAFKESGLKEISIPSSIKFVGIGAFAGCPLEKINMDENNSLFDTTKGINAIVSKDDKKLIAGCKTTIIPDYVKTIGAYSFYGMDVEEINLPLSVEEILNYSFYNCNLLKKINISHNVKNIGACAFSSNTKVFYDGTMEEFMSIYHCSKNESSSGLIISCIDGTYTYDDSTLKKGDFDSL